MADMIYRLVLRAQFENQAELTKAVEGLNQLQVSGAKVNVQMGGIGRAGTESMTGLATSVLRVGFMFNMMESALMRQDMATMMAENAQNRLSDAIARYGANSEQARRATKQMEAEMSYLNSANIRANVSMGLMATQLLLQSNLLNKATLAEIAHTAAEYGGVLASGARTAARYVETAAIWLKNAAMTAEITLEAMLAPYLVPIMLGAAAAITAGLAGYGFASKPPPSKQEGGYISETKPYMLHAGEWVLPSKEVTSFKSLQTGGLIEKEGLYHLHTGEKVLSRDSIRSNEVFLASIKERSTTNIEKSALKEQMNNRTSLLSTVKEFARMPSSEMSAHTVLSTFNFETNLHIETDLDAALAEQNRRIKNEYRRSAA